MVLRGERGGVLLWLLAFSLGLILISISLFFVLQTEDKQREFSIEVIPQEEIPPTPIDEDIPKAISINEPEPISEENKEIIEEKKKSSSSSSKSSSKEVEDPVCGNQVVESGEECDGVVTSTTCINLGYSGGSVLCSNCVFDLSLCILDEEPEGPTCGNAVLDSDEECDGEILASQTCESQGFDEGVLSCSSSCELDTSACSNIADPCEGLDAVIIEVLPPEQVIPDSDFTVEVTIANVGSEQWGPENSILLEIISEPNNFWGDSQFSLPSFVNPGEQTSIGIELVSPSEPGTYPIQAQMSKLNTCFFGTESDLTTIDVEAEVEEPPEEPPPEEEEFVSILGFQVGGDVDPIITVNVDELRNTDVGPRPIDDPEGWINYDNWINNNGWPFNSLAPAFAGEDEELIKKFRKDFYRGGDYFKPNYLWGPHPYCNSEDNYNVIIRDSIKPYEYDQGEFLAWLEENTNKDDFLSASARRDNNYLGNLECPIREGSSPRTIEELKRTNGKDLSIEKDKFQLIVDNRYNPMRWFGPNNQILHHELSGSIVNIPTSSDIQEETKEIMRDNLNGIRDQRIILSYDIDLEVEDYTDDFSETNVRNLYEDNEASIGDDLHSVTHWSAWKFSKIGESSYGMTPSDIQKDHIFHRLQTRFIPHSIAISLPVGWRIGDGKWRTTSFQLVGLNYKDGISSHFTSTGNDVVNDFSFEGRTSGTTGWNRPKLSVFDEFDDSDVSPIISGGDYFELGDGDSSVKLEGVLDLTDYYILSRRHDFFPGEKAVWADKTLGFEVCDSGSGIDTSYCDPDEEHGIYRAGFVIEVNGPYKIDATINKLDVYIVDEEDLDKLT